MHIKKSLKEAFETDYTNFYHLYQAFVYKIFIEFGGVRGGKEIKNYLPGLRHTK